MCNYARSFFKKDKPKWTRRLQSKNRLIIEIIAGLSLLASGTIKVETEITATATSAPSQIERSYKDPEVGSGKTVREVVENYFSDIPLMDDIAWCESRMRQTNSDGTIFRGLVNPNDVGVMQINTMYHLEDSKKMGLDIFTLEGNLKYARYLFEKQGAAPWKSSSPCWAKRSNLVAVK